MVNTLNYIRIYKRQKYKSVRSIPNYIEIPFNIDARQQIKLLRSQLKPVNVLVRKSDKVDTFDLREYYDAIILIETNFDSTFINFFKTPQSRADINYTFNNQTVTMNMHVYVSLISTVNTRQSNSEYSIDDFENKYITIGNYKNYIKLEIFK